MANSSQICKNCEQQFNSAYNFCPHCGQQAKDELTVKVLFYNTISNYFSFDARFFKSFLPLLFKPGYLAVKFVQGKRLLYLHPAQMYLFIAVVFFFLFSFVQRSQVRTLDEKIEQSFKEKKRMELLIGDQERDSIKNVRLKQKQIDDSIARAEIRKALEGNKIIHGYSDSQIDSLMAREDFRKNDIATFDISTASIDSLLAVDAPNKDIYKAMGMSDDPGYFERRFYAQALKFYKSRQGGSILQAFYDAIPIAMFFLLPIFAFIIKLFHLKKGQYAHHLVFSFYFFSFLFAAFSIILGINYIVDFPDWLDFILLWSTFIYLVIALRKFYNQGWVKSFIKGALTSFIFLIIVAPITVALLGIFAFLFY